MSRHSIDEYPQPSSPLDEAHLDKPKLAFALFYLALVILALVGAVML